MTTDAARRFRAAIEARDLDAMRATLSPDVTFFSPVKFTPFQGIDAVAGLLGVVANTFEDFRYVGELTGAAEAGDGGAAVDSDVLVFRARIGDRAVHGIDMIQPGADGLIRNFTVMIRPLSAAQAVGEAILRGLVAAGLVPAPGNS
jgi:ketosteroid isomerase-like protein